jgi:hypothetical protein
LLLRVHFFFYNAAKEKLVGYFEKVWGINFDVEYNLIISWHFTHSILYIFMNQSNTTYKHCWLRKKATWFGWAQPSSGLYI